jgi:WD40 repeat protein
MEVTELTFTSDGKRWASTTLVENAPGKAPGWSGLVGVWDRRSDNPQRTWLADSGHVQRLLFAVKGDLLIGRCAFPNHIEIWDSRTGVQRYTFSLGDSESTEMAVSADGRFLIAAAGKGLTRWDLTSGQPHGHSQPIQGHVLALSRDAELLLVLDPEGELRISRVSSMIKE